MQDLRCPLKSRWKHAHKHAALLETRNLKIQAIQMAISLSKGGNVLLSQFEPGLKKILVRLEWDARGSGWFDLDASAFLLGANGKVSSDFDLVFYNSTIRTKDERTTFPDPGGVDSNIRGRPCHPSLCVIGAEDNQTGEGDGDDETITIALDAVPATVSTIAIVVTIHDAEQRRQNFGQLINAYIRVVNKESQKEIARYDLAEDYSTETAILFGEIYRRNNEWKFRAVGQGYAGGIATLCTQYGIDVA
jgi:tellurium resistance protein TerD